jgi:hypothetical protein
VRKKLFPYCSHAMGGVPRFSMEVIEKYGRHEETRTPDLYRVKGLRFSILNNLQESVGLLSLCKFLIICNRASAVRVGLRVKHRHGRLLTASIFDLDRKRK